MKRGFYLLLAVAAVMALTTVSMVAAAKPDGKGKPKPNTENTGPGATGRGSYVTQWEDPVTGEITYTTVTISFEAGIDAGSPYGKLKHTPTNITSNIPIN